MLYYCGDCSASAPAALREILVRHYTHYRTPPLMVAGHSACGANRAAPSALQEENLNFLNHLHIFENFIAKFFI